MNEIEEYLCSHCDVKFTHAGGTRNPRCPTCLRGQGMIPVSAAAAERVRVPPARIALLLSVALVVLAVVGGGFLYLRMISTKGRGDQDPGIDAQLKAKGVVVATSERDFRVTPALSRAAFEITGEKPQREKALAIHAQVVAWLKNGKITRVPQGDVPLPLTAETFLSAISKLSQRAGAYQVAVTTLALLRAAGLQATLAERRDVKNAVSVIARKRFGVVVTLSKSKLWLDPWANGERVVPKSVTPLSDLQVLALGLAFRAVALISDSGKSTKENRLRQATSAVERALRLWPASASIQFARGQVNLLSGMLALGIRDFQLALRREEDALGRHNLGVALMQQNRLDDGVAQLKRALQLDPSLIPSYTALARARLQSFALLTKAERDTMVSDVETLLTKAEKLARKPAPDLFFLRGQVYLLKRDASAAVRYFRKEVSAFPRSDQAYFALAQFYLKAEKYKDGAELIGKLVKHAPMNPRARVLLAQFLVKAGDLDQARAQYEKAIVLNPKLPNLRLGLAQLLLQQRKSAQAIATAKNELRAFPNNFAAYIFLAVLYRAQGKRGEAQRVMADALKRTTRKEALKKAFLSAFKQVDSKKAVTPSTTTKPSATTKPLKTPR